MPLMPLLPRMLHLMLMRQPTPMDLMETVVAEAAVVARSSAP